MAKIVSINKKKEDVYSSLKSLLKEFENGEIVSFVGIAMHKDDGLWIYTTDEKEERKSHRVGLAQVLSQCCRLLCYILLFGGRGFLQA